MGTLNWKFYIIAAACLIVAAMAPASPAHASIGYGSSDAVYSAKNQEYFYMGFSQGLERALKPKLRKKLMDSIKVEQLADKKPVSAIRAAKTLLDEGVTALVGFPTSHEALLVAKMADRQNTLFISAAAAHSGMVTFGDSVYSLGESVVESKKALIRFVNQKFSNKKGLLVTNDQFVFSVDQAKALHQLNETSASKLNLEEAHLVNGQTLDNATLKRIKSGNFQYIILTMYADDSTHFLNQLIENKIKLPLIANSSWTIGSTELVRRFLFQFEAPVYCVASVVKGLETAKVFESDNRLKYGKDPETEMYYGYDLGQVVGQTYNRINGPINRQTVLSAFRKKPCFTNATTGDVCFPKEGGHALRTIYWLRFTKKRGFVPIDSSRSPRE